MDTASLDAMDSPRTFHYVFAHRTLPIMAARDAEGLLEGLQKNGPSLLRLQWKATCLALGLEAQPSEAIGYGPGSDQMALVALAYLGERALAGYTVALVQLPLVLQVREAHFVAIAHRAGRTRFLAWERTLDGRARMAEWTLTPQGPRGRRIGPVSDETGLDDFVDALDRWLQSPPPAVHLAPGSLEAPARPVAPASTVTRADMALVGALLVAWTMMIMVLTLL